MPTEEHILYTYYTHTTSIIIFYAFKDYSMHALVVFYDAYTYFTYFLNEYE
jgi:hypothetical protein